MNHGLRLASIVILLGYLGMGAWSVCACGHSALSDHQQSENSNMQQHEPLAVFYAAIEIQTSSLKVTYELENVSQQVLGIFNYIPGSGGFTDENFKLLDKNNVYIDFIDGVAYLSKVLISIPPDIEMGELPVPFVSRLMPGMSFEEEFEVLLPLEVNHPVRLATINACGPNSFKHVSGVKQLVFSIGVFPGDADIEFKPVKSSQENAYSVWPIHIAQSRQQILTKTFSTAIDAVSPGAPDECHNQGN